MARTAAHGTGRKISRADTKDGLVGAGGWPAGSIRPIVSDGIGQPGRTRPWQAGPLVRSTPYGARVSYRFMHRVDPLRSVHDLTAGTPAALATCLRNSPRQARGKAHLAK